ncbi:DUF6011 domain-containing protein [Mycobacterium sp. MAA66]|uniref:DUF6011 domain-containing protein n=1 Tax=Mycobacterium sp. MAA66 TaxID=3156297 RepID=UPI0035115F12
MKKLEKKTTTAGKPAFDDSDDWRIARRCRACGSWLTSPQSVTAGIGPACAQAEATRQ